ncbi:actin organization and endocytosis protein [Lobaria immixta]|nr:actin organization and endocytosis protein [Lobaria immixta]
MPQPLYENGRITAGLAGIAPVAWAVTKAEKKECDRVFEAYDKLNVGLTEHGIAIEAIGQSYLPIMELEKIYALVDQENKGKIYMHQFAVAMHLIRRIIKGYALPNHLSPELVTPWVKKFLDSIGNAESSMFQDGQQHQTGTYHLGNCSLHANIKALMVAMIQDLEQELADLRTDIRGASFMQPAHPLVSWRIAYGYNLAPAV